MRRPSSSRRRIRSARIVIALAWSCLAWASMVPAAHALGLPLVDLPTAGSVASDAMDAASKAIVNLIATAVGSLTNEIIKVSDTVAAPQVGADNAWFTASYKRTMGVSLYLMAIASLIAITAAGIRGKVGDIAQVIFVGIPSSVIAMMLATVGVRLSLALTDAMTAYTFRSSVGDIQTFLHDIGTVFTSTGGAAQPTAQLAPGLVLIIGLLLIVAQLVILAVLIIRAALIYIVTLFLPLVFAVQVWPATRHMTRKAIELLAVLIVSKFAIFTCFALGAGATRDLLNPAASGGPPAVQSAIVGFGVMAAAAFSPMLLMSIIPGIAGSFGAGMPGGTAGGGALAVKTPSQIMRSTLAGVHSVRGGSHTSSSQQRSSGRSGGSGAQRPPAPPSSGAPGSGARGAAGAGAEQAHTGASAHPAAAAAVGGSQVLAQGAQSAARATQRAATDVGSSSGSTGSPDGDRSLSTSSSPPHIVSERSASSSGKESTGTSAESGASSSRPEQLSLDSTAPHHASADGFAQVSTRQPFTLETT